MKRTLTLFSVFCLLLSLLTGSAAVFAESAGTEGYQVQVTDDAGDPVSGAMVQFCSDSECMMGVTDDAGMAQFDQPAGSYTVHVLKVPEGFAADSTEYAAPEEPGLIAITLAKEAGGETEEAPDAEDVLDYPALGFHFEKPEKFRNLKGVLDWSSSYLEPGLLEITADYYAVPEDQMDAYTEYVYAYIDAFVSGEQIPEAPDPSWETGYESATIFNVYAVNDERGVGGVRKAAIANYPPDTRFSWLEEIGRDGDTVFYAGQLADLEEEKEDYQEAMGEYYDELSGMCADKEAFLSALTMSAPDWPEVLSAGDVISFETVDLDGNPVSSEELFAGHTVTMINLWATWCGPCKEELPELGQMAEEFAAENCQIIGVCHDAGEEGMAEEAKAILEEAGAAYLNLTAPEDVDDIFNNTAFPTSYFVDGEGKLLVDPIEGADPDAYREALKEALELAG